MPKPGPSSAYWPASRRNSPKLILLLRDEKDTLKAIEQIYGWDEKKLDLMAHKDVLAKAMAGRRLYSCGVK